MNIITIAIAASSLASALLVEPLLVPNQARADENFRSANFPDRFIRHRNLLMYIEPITDALSSDDSAFDVVFGLAGKCHSFQSRNFRGFYIRHQNLRLKLNKYENTDLFRKDATFCIREGLANSEGSSFESFNYRGSFIRHQDLELRIQPNDGSVLFKRDATFYRLTAGTSFGDDNVGIAAPAE